MLKVISHPRAGSHFLTALIAKNFYNTDDYLQLYGGHAVEYRKTFDNHKLIYIWRDFWPTAQSVFKIRKRFGISTDDFEEFFDTPLKDLWSDKLKFEITVNTINKKETINTVDGLFKNTDKTFYTYWYDHLTYWNNYPKVLSINYNMLINHQKYILEKVSSFLGKKLTKIKPINEKVGWY